MTDATISADEALLWLRDYQSHTAELGLEAVNNSFEIARIIWEVHDAGGWDKLAETNKSAETAKRARLRDLQQRQTWIRTEFERRKARE